MGSIKQITVPLLLTSAVFSASSLVMAAQPDAGQVQHLQKMLQPTLPNYLEKPETGKVKSKPAAAVKPEKAEVHVQVKEFRFTGAEGLAKEQELQALVADAVGHALNFAELQQRVLKVTEYLKNKGFFLASAYLPKQDVTSGVIEIAIVQGKLDNIKVTGHNLRMNPAQLQAIAQQAVPVDAAVRMQNLERAVLLINDLPGISARSQLAAGDKPDSTQWMLDVTEGPLLTANVWVDNYGNRYTGADRINAHVSLNDPKQKGDQLSLSLTHAVDLDSQQVDYTIPVCPKGVNVHLGYSHLNFEVGKELSNLDTSGSAQTKSLGLTYPWIRSRALNLWATTGYDWKFLKDKSVGTVTRDKHVGVLNVGVSGNSYDSFYGGGLNNFSVSLAGGNLDLSNVPADLAADSATAGTDGGYVKMNYSAARLQRVTPSLAFFAALNGQYAGQNLDSSEKFILGGPSGIRAYPSGEASGDRGEIVNLELRYDFIPQRLNQWGSWQLVTFFDAGQITLYDNPWTGAITTISGANTYTLKGAGLGLNLTHGADYAVHAAWARQIGSNQGRSTAGLNSDGLDHKSAFWLQALAWF